MEEIKNVNPKDFGKVIKQKFTLFYRYGNFDDEFEGEIGNDDEKMPLISTTLIIDEAPLEPIDDSL